MDDDSLMQGGSGLAFVKVLVCPLVWKRKENHGNYEHCCAFSANFSHQHKVSTINK